VEKVEGLKTGDCKMTDGLPNAVFRRNLAAVLEYRPTPYQIGLII